MLNRSANWRLLFLGLLLGWSTATAQQKVLNYGIVSPNTRENLKLEEAIKGMNSREEFVLQPGHQLIAWSGHAFELSRRWVWSDGPSIQFYSEYKATSRRALCFRRMDATPNKYVIIFILNPRAK